MKQKEEEEEEEEEENVMRLLRQIGNAAIAKLELLAEDHPIPRLRRRRLRATATDTAVAPISR